MADNISITEKDSTISVGSVRMNMTYYGGSDLYSEGDIEDKLLSIVKETDDYEDVLMQESEWSILYHLSPIRQNVINWYDFKEGSSCLEIGAGCGAITGALCDRCGTVTCIELSKRRSMINAYRNASRDNLEIIVGNFRDIEIKEKYDYVTLIGVLEYAPSYIGSESPFADMLERCRGYLKPGGKLIVAIENKYGMKYWSGVHEDHTGKMYDGIMGYLTDNGVTTFSRGGLEKLLEGAGFRGTEFYYPMPDYKLPMSVYSDRRLPESGEIWQDSHVYDKTFYKMFSEASAYESVVKDGLYPVFANSFLVVASLDVLPESDAAYVKLNTIRAPKYRTRTVKLLGGGVRYRKQPECEAAREHIADIYKGYMLLRDYYNSIEVCPCSRVGEDIEFEEASGELLSEYMLKSVTGYEDFMETVRTYMDRVLDVRDEFKKTFELSDGFRELFGEVELPEGTPALSVSNIDSNFDNFVMIGDKLTCIDYEWVVDFDVPVDYLRYRILRYLYDRYGDGILSAVTREELFENFGIAADVVGIYDAMELRLQFEITGEDNCYNYQVRYAKTYTTFDALVEHDAWATATMLEKIEELQETATKLNHDVRVRDGQIIEYAQTFKSPSKMTKYYAKRAKGVMERRLLRGNDISTAARKVTRRLRGDVYSRWLKQHTPTEQELAAQRETSFAYRPRISILVPLYNTNPVFLQELMDAVLAQTYDNWEICLSDGSPEHAAMKPVLEPYLTDERVKYVAGDKYPLGISENTNQAYSVATGDYIMLCDHDDLIYPESVYEVVKTINDEGADVIYTDEDKVSEDGEKRFLPAIKPDFSPYYLESGNYITHLYTVKRSIVEEVGLFDERMNGAQDYDFILRTTEKAEKVVHIPKVLYSWRLSETSTAGNENAKTYAYDAGTLALEEHYKRMGIVAGAEKSEYAGYYSSVYELRTDPLVSAVIRERKPDKAYLAEGKLKVKYEETIYSVKRADYKRIEVMHNQERAHGKYVLLIRPGVRLADGVSISSLIAYMEERPEVTAVSGCVNRGGVYRHGGLRSIGESEEYLELIREDSLTKALYSFREFPVLRTDVILMRADARLTDRAAADEYITAEDGEVFLYSPRLEVISE